RRRRPRAFARTGPRQASFTRYGGKVCANVNASGVGPRSQRISNRAFASSTVGIVPDSIHHRACDVLPSGSNQLFLARNTAMWSPAYVNAFNASIDLQTDMLT